MQGYRDAEREGREPGEENENSDSEDKDDGPQTRGGASSPTSEAPNDDHAPIMTRQSTASVVDEEEIDFDAILRQQEEDEAADSQPQPHRAAPVVNA